jgi:glycosyltransferase involved in cell wall biosynthesis
VKVGIESVPFYGNLSGVGQYSTRLIEAASSVDDSKVQFEIVRPLMPWRKFRPAIAGNKHLSYRIVRWFPPIIYYQMFKRLGWAPPYDLVALKKYDAFLFFNFVAFPVRKKTPSLVVIYDLSFIYYPQYTQRKNLPYMLKFVPRSVKRASRIITISENSKKEIIDHYKIGGDMVEIINPAVDHKIFKPQPADRISQIAAKYRIGGSYILCVATLEPRKNLIGVLEAFEKLPENIKSTHSLVLVGGKGWLDGELEKKYELLASKYSLIKTGYVPDEDLPALYSGAEVFVYPSFYEGFGMPPLEAMACGTPVITSDSTSLPEVVGDAGIMIKAEDTSELANQIEKVLRDKELADSLRAKGLIQAKKFTWDESAKRLLRVIEEVGR